MILLAFQIGGDCECHRAFAEERGEKILLDIERQFETTAEVLVSRRCDFVTGGLGRDAGEARTGEDELGGAQARRRFRIL